MYLSYTKLQGVVLVNTHVKQYDFILNVCKLSLVITVECVLIFQQQMFHISKCMQ